MSWSSCCAPASILLIHYPLRPYFPEGMLIGVAGNVLKQNAISPPPKDPEMATEEEAGRRECDVWKGVI